MGPGAVFKSKVFLCLPCRRTYHGSLSSFCVREQCSLSICNFETPLPDETLCFPVSYRCVHTWDAGRYDLWE